MRMGAYAERALALGLGLGLGLGLRLGLGLGLGFGLGSGSGLEFEFGVGLWLRLGLSSGLELRFGYYDPTYRGYPDMIATLTRVPHGLSSTSWQYIPRHQYGTVSWATASHIP